MEDSDRGDRVQVWAGVALLVVCLLVGTVEASTVLAAATTGYFIAWLLVFGVFLVGLVAAAVLTPARSPNVRLASFVPPIVAASAIVLLSPNRGGMTLILLVFVAALCAMQTGPRITLVVIAWNGAVIVAATSALGPLVNEPSQLGEIVLVVVLYTLLQAGSAAMVWSQQQESRALQEVSIAHVKLRGASALLAESSQAQERLRISRDLHDVIGHQLTALALELEIASHRATDPAREHVVRARSLAKELLTDVRSVVGNERHRSFDLEAALISVVSDVPRPRVHLDVAADLDSDDERAIALIHAVQEIVTNAIRHSHATNLWIQLTSDDDAVYLAAHDDGVGARDVVVGNGLRGLQERVAALGGAVELDASTGFRIRAELRVREATQA